MAVVPVVKKLWDSNFVDKASSSIIKYLIDILKTTLEGGEEVDAFKRGQDHPPRKQPPFKPMKISDEDIQLLTGQGVGEDEAREGLYRCYNNTSHALGYCSRLNVLDQSARLPVPDYDKEKPSTSSETGVSAPQPQQSTQSQDDTTAMDLSAADQDATAAATGLTLLSQGERLPPLVDMDSLVEVEEAEGEDTASNAMAPPPAPRVPPESEIVGDDGMAMSIDNLLHPMFGGPDGTERIQSRTPSRSPASSMPESRTGPVDDTKTQHFVTVNDLDDIRNTIRENLLDRALDVLNVHDDVTFELSDLITAATTKAPDAKSMRSDVSSMLIQSLLSFMEDDFRSSAKKIAAYANLLALVLQDRDFYEASLGELKDNFENLLGYLKIFTDQSPDEKSPWIGQTLAVIEKVLSEDVQPAQIGWTAPTNGASSDTNLVHMDPPLVPLEVKTQLFEAILDIMPRVGKDESLVLSIVRTLVNLTRNRSIASKLGEKRNIQRVFVMIKQLSGMTDERLLSAFMILVRHIVEDEDIIRQIMRSEIMSTFETRPSRQTDTTGYVRQMYPLVLRSPEIFVEVTNEKLEIPRYDGSQRPQTLGLKPETADNMTQQMPATGPEAAAAESGQEQDSTEKIPVDVAERAKTTENKAPVVEHPSGVVHYLLSELLSYKEVEDKDPSKQVTHDESSGGSNPSKPSNTGSIPGLVLPPSESNLPKKTEKPEFKPEQHPIYVYRCFILQCLTELLQSYNQTKVEFINFSRKADAKATTPSKPRSGVLNYLLNDLIPVGTLAHGDSIAYRKKHRTSNLAMSVIVALCLKTNETGYEKKPGSLDQDEQPDLLFVRKFVLEHALKAYKDANASDEYPDMKYSRLLDIADLFNRLLAGKLIAPENPSATPVEVGAQRAIAKLMFEKNFIAALTSSIADVDLNFPKAERAIKYILRPLKHLTNTAIYLSETSSISTTPGQTDEDDISSATSVSEMNEEREETPDLFRNSTLGMFEPGREDESDSNSSEGDDEEMYDDEYDEGMEFEDGMERDGEDVVSDEDEDLGEAGQMEGLHGDTGMDVEVVIDGEDDEPSDEDEDLDASENENDDVEALDEISGDDEGASLAEGEDDEWQDEMEERDGDPEDFDANGGLDRDHQDADSAVRDIVREFGGAEAALQRLEGLAGNHGPSELDMDIESGRYMDDVIHRDEDEGSFINFQA